MPSCFKYRKWSAGRAVMGLAALTVAASPSHGRQPVEQPVVPPMERRIDAVFKEYNRTDSPGCALGVYRDGAIVYARGYGMADLEQGVSISSRTVFDIGSTSKQFTAASMALLAQDGKLALDDDVREYLPELPEFERPITIRHMLNHTSGLRDYIELMLMAGVDIDDVTGDDEALAALVRQRALNFQPGSEWLYSNSGYFLASVIIERVTGKSLPEFAKARIFEPLGMRHTLYRNDYALVIPNRASAYAPLPEGGYAIDMSNWQQTGDGAVFTSVEDLLLWDRNFYEPAVGGQRLLSDLLTAGVLSGGDTLDYALGLFRGEYRGLPTVSHGGSWGGYRADLLRFPDQRFSVAVLCNLATTNPSRLARSVADLYLEDRLGPVSAADTTDRPAGDLPAAVFRKRTGTYQDPGGGGVRVLELQDGALKLRAFGMTLDLLPLSETEFVATGIPVDLTLRFESGDPDRLIETLDGDSTAYARVETVHPKPAELRAYTGRFYSPELDATYEVRRAGEVLRLVPPGGGEPVELAPLRQGAFHGGGMSIRFQESGERVSGFLLDRGRVRGLNFERAMVECEGREGGVT